MDATHRFLDAMAMQTDWIYVLVTQRGQSYTTWRRRRALLFAFMHSCFIMVLFGHFTHHILTWALVILMQALAFCISLFHTILVMDYEDRMNNAMELEQQLNPLIVAALSIRCFSSLHIFLIGAWVICVLCFVELLYSYWVFSKGDFLVDATTAWKKLDALKLDSRVRLLFQGVFFMVATAELVVSLLFS